MASVTGDDTGTGFGVEGTSVAKFGLFGRSDTGVAVYGECKSGDGVLGRSASAAGAAGHSSTGPGVEGRSKSAPGVSGSSDTSAGAFGESDAGVGVAGHSKHAPGVSGESDEDNGILGATQVQGKAGVFGYSEVDGNTDEPGIGTVGYCEGLSGIGVLGHAPRRGTGVIANGAWGITAHGAVGPGVQAVSEGAHGVAGFTSRGGFAGVVGSNDDSAGFGVAGYSDAGIGVYGESHASHPAVRGAAHGNGAGVLGQNPDPFGAGVYGDSDNGVGIEARSMDGIALRAMSQNNLGLHASGKIAALFGGDVFVGGGTTFIAAPLWVAGETKGAALFSSLEGNTIYTTVEQLGIALHAVATNPGAPSTYAGMFDGDVNVNGTFRKTSSHFLIDHPIEPADKYLEHCAVESSEMKTFYDGTATLDADGRATVRLPDWFEALNRDIRYQLTAIGRAAPELHIAQEVEHGLFVISGGEPSMRVCWQVTARRRDAWAEAHPMQVERDKPAGERGYYLYPELHGAAADQRIRHGTERDPRAEVEKAFQEMRRMGDAAQAEPEPVLSHRPQRPPAPFTPPRPGRARRG